MTSTSLTPPTTLDNNRRLAIKQTVLRALTPVPNDTQHTTAARVLEKAMADLSVYGTHRYCYQWPPLATMGYQGSVDYPWCAAAIVRWFRLAGGVDLRTRVTQWAYVPALYKYFAWSPYWITVPVATAPAGSVVIYLRNGIPFHIELTRGHYANGVLPTIGGDTSSPQFPGSDSTGGVLALRNRNVAAQTSGGYSMRIWRPAYSQPPVPKPLPAPVHPLLNVTLQMGSTGQHVRNFQQGARDHLKSHVVVDGIFGPYTRGTVESFQRIRKLKVDGIIGPRTQAELQKFSVYL